MPTSVPTHGRQHDADHRDAERVDDADEEGAEVGVFRTVGEPAVGDRHPGLAAEESEAGRDAAHREIMQRRSTRARRRWRPAIPTTTICQSSPESCCRLSENAQRACGGGVRAWISSQHKDPSVESSDLRHMRRRGARSYVASKCDICNICFMAQPQSKSSPLNELCSALPSLPTRLQEVGRFVAANDYDATTRSMRELAAVAGADPASFTRLAKALGYSGWDELRAALTEARRPEQSSPFSGRARGAARAVPTPTIVAGRGQAGGRSGGPCAYLGRLGRRRGAGRCMARGGSGSRVFAAAAAWRSCSIISFACSGPTTVQLVGGSGPGGSRPRRLPRRRCRRRHRLCALFHGERAVGARGA